MVNRVIFLLNSTFNRRDYHRYGFDIIRSRGYEIEIWDFTPVLKPHYFNHYTPPDPINSDICKLFHAKIHIKQAIHSLSSNDLVFSAMGIDQFNLFIYQILKDKGIIFGFGLTGMFPSRKWSLGYILSLTFNDPFSVPIQIFNRLKKVFTKITGGKLPILTSAYLITGGKTSANSGQYPVSNTTHIIKAHSFDYDRYLDEESKEEKGLKNEKPYVVFLDVNMPYHPDYLYSNIVPYCTAEKYYPEMNRFFDFFEQKTGLRVIIAAHPRANYAKKGNPYGRRPIVSEKTICLVKYAIAAIAHISTSVNFAVLYKKPMIFLNSTNYDIRLQNRIVTQAHALGENPIFISDNYSNHFELNNINDTKYATYKELYIKETGTPEKPIWEIFADYLDSII